MEHGPMDEQGRSWGRAARWAVPGVAVLAVGGVIAGTSVAGAQAAPVLPARSAQQLLADVAQSAGTGPMTATVQETANLGLPALPSTDGPSSLYSMLSGTHTFNVWYADPAHLRISEPVQLGETDLRVDGRQAWLWDSKTQTATHVVAGAAVLPGGPARFEPGPGRMCYVRVHPSSGRDIEAPMCVKRPGFKGLPRLKAPRFKAPRFRALPRQQHFTPPTPQQAARQVLAAIGPTTSVSVQRNVTVAGQAAYQIALAPKTSKSLIARVVIAIDAARSFPLRLQVFARGSAVPAFQIGFTALSFGRPAASNFSFTPPPGAKVKTATVPLGPLGFPLRLLGPQASVNHDRSLAGGAWMPDSTPAFMSAAPTVVGQGWLSVLVVQGGTAVPDVTSSGGSQVVFAIPSPDSSSPGWSTRATSTMHSDSAAPPGAGALGPGPLGPLLRSATPVHGAWGSGRLLHTTLINILITSKGTVLAGAVQPSVLYADAAGK
jgi:hypothetical protein